jgi:hypothetical protein
MNGCREKRLAAAVRPGQPVMVIRNVYLAERIVYTEPAVPPEREELAFRRGGGETGADEVQHRFH